MLRVREAYGHFRADDAPPWLTILVVGHITIPIILALEQTLDLALWVELAIYLPLITLLTAKTLVSPIRTLTYEAPLLGWPLTLARFVPGVLLPPVMGLIGQWLFGLFKRWG